MSFNINTPGGHGASSLGREFLGRVESYYKATGVPYAIHKGCVWQVYQHMIVPVTPPNISHDLSHTDIKILLSKLPGAMVRWTQGFNTSEDPAWYSVICDDFLPVEEIDSKSSRRNIRAGLRRCEVRQVTAEFVAKFGYSVYLDALERYTGDSVKAMSQTDFVNRAMQDIDFTDLIDYWGVFIDGKLTAYARNWQFGKHSVNYSEIKFSQASLKNYATFALIYEMNCHYLSQKNVQFVNDGYCALLHETGIQELLIQRLNFHKAGHELHVAYRAPLGLWVKLAYPLRGLFSRFDSRIESILKQEEIRRVKV